MKTTYVAVYFETVDNNTLTTVICEGTKSKCENSKKNHNYISGSVDVMTKNKYDNLLCCLA